METARPVSPATAEPCDDGPLLGRNLVWGLTAGGSSTVVHLALLLILGLMITPQLEKPRPFESVGFLEKPREPEDFPRILQEKPTAPAPSHRIPGCYGPTENHRRIFKDIADTLHPPRLTAEAARRMEKVSIDVGTQIVFTNTPGSLVQSAEGAYGEALQNRTDYDDAMDGITQEILNKLARGKVLVVWMFDQSESMVDDRQEITDRVKRVYEELGLAHIAAGDALMSSVMSYGAATALHTPQPTADLAQIGAAIGAVPVDPSGQEMMCSAIYTAVAQHQKFAQLGGRQLMCVVVTDESGDMASNISQLESTIAAAKAARCPVYFLGREAVFGYPFAHMRWTDPGTKLDFWLRIDRGPETPFPEQLQVDGIHRRYDAHPSGFGPYEQSRLARQTGGVFFLLPSPEADLWRRDDRTYEPEAMRAYLPDLGTRSDYAAERDKHPLRAAIWKVIRDLNPYDENLKNVVQVRFWDWPIERTAFAREAEANIRKAHTLMQYFAQAQQTLEAVEPLRRRESSPRWRANFDVTYAQTIAYQARLAEYVAYLTAFVQTPKAIKNEFGAARPTNAWDGAYVKRTLVADAKVAALREKSTRLFQQVAKEHPGTPWAARAEYELGRGFGCELREDHEDPRRSMVKPPVY